jgi:hypothetical protein
MEFFEIKKMHGHYELCLNKEIDGKMNALLIGRTKTLGFMALGSLVLKCNGAMGKGFRRRRKGTD